MAVFKERVITVKRFNSGSIKTRWEETYVLPLEERATVLQALQYIYENLDPSIAFEYSCRYDRCGLCGVEINGRPCLACTAFLNDHRITVAPLSNLTVIRDLVIDREPYEKLLKDELIYYSGEGLTESSNCEEAKAEHHFKPILVPPGLESLLSCVECLCCHAACPKLDSDDTDLTRFAGPLVFLKLAQLHLDPRDLEDRKAQARRLGIEQCTACRRCYCSRGIPLYRLAIETLLR